MATDPKLTEPIAIDPNADPFVASVGAASQALDKLTLLLEREGIDTDDPERWFRLAFRLAVKHEPGFQLKIKVKRGRKARWDETALALLWLSIEQQKLRRPSSLSPLSNSAASRAVAKLFKQKSGTLRRQISNAERLETVQWVSEMRRQYPGYDMEFLQALELLLKSRGVNIGGK